jgi:general secretion pathway protein L
VAAGVDSPDGQRAIAVADRAWLETVIKVLLAEGARRVMALPGQLCLPLAPGGVTAAIDSSGVAMRQGPYQGLGMALDAPPAVALQTVRALAGTAPLTLLVPPEQLGEYQALVAEAEPGVLLEAEQWNHWIAGARACTLDLVAGLGTATAKPRDWQRWKWPLRLVLAVFLVNVAGLNIEWLRMKRETQAIRQSMTQTFRQVYPNEPPLDPLAQMRRNIGKARASRGQLNPEEFTYLAAAFGEATRALPRPPSVASLTYADRVLTVKARPDTVDAGATAQLQSLLAGRKLAVTENGPGVWQVSNKGGQ